MTITILIALLFLLCCLIFRTGQVASAILDVTTTAEVVSPEATEAAAAATAASTAVVVVIRLSHPEPDTDVDVLEGAGEKPARSGESHE